MSNVGLIIEERPTNIGKFLVGRLLPFIDKRSIGPFVFIDHMGPAQISSEEFVDIGAHPHIGLSTLTFLFEGKIRHKDTLGTDIEIGPGAVNWMTAGKGIVHSERTPERLRKSDEILHGLQIWVALPKEMEETEPSFHHISEEQIPQWQQGNASFKLIAGKAFDKESPVPVYSPLYFIEIKCTGKQTVSIGNDLYGESGLYILEGSINSDGHSYGAKQILIANDTKLCEFEAEAGTTVYIFGGEALPEKRYMFWNFVATTPELIEQAKQKWEALQFPKIEGETNYIPLPKSKLQTKK